MKADIGIIGGTGIYDPDLIKNSKKVKISTPFGPPSDLITIGNLAGKKMAFIPRHSSNHKLNPSNINYRANIFAFKKLGVTRIFAPCAVGSLKEEMKPGDIVFVNQFIDRTYLRKQTFHDKGRVCHISVAEPICPELRIMLVNASKKLGLPYHENGTYVCIEGPRFSTKAESKLFRSWDADVIGMTLVPECILAREAEICYTSIAMVTDYDVWKEKTVSTEEIIKTMKENAVNVKNLIVKAIENVPDERRCLCKDALKNAFV